MRRAFRKGFQGQTELHATLKGPLKDKTKIEAHFTIPVLKASYQSLQIGIASPIRADYSNSVVTLQPAEIQGTGTSLRVQGTNTDWWDSGSDAIGARLGRHATFSRSSRRMFRARGRSRWMCTLRDRLRSRWFKGKCRSKMLR